MFWVAYVGFFFVQNTFFSSSGTPLGNLGSLCLTVIVDIGAAYFTVYYLLPKFLFTRKYLQFGILFIFSAAFAILFQRVLMYYISYPLFYSEYMSNLKGFWSMNPFYTFFNIYTVVGLFTSIKLLKYWYRNQQVKTELENKNRISELALLRSQLNPHFIFNTLNNIDSLIMTNPEKASDSIMKLSEIMRFMVYDIADVIPLEKEVNYLKSYISLQQLRLKNQNFVKFTFDGECGAKTIAPMLFIPFVENAFKHGLKNVNSPGIEISLNCMRNSINFEVTNFFDGNMDLNKDKTPGIGLINTKRRLELLYPNMHDFVVKKNDGVFSSKLTIFYKT
jgi:LytS/YehU family sensor histidine kinase